MPPWTELDEERIDRAYRAFLGRFHPPGTARPMTIKKRRRHKETPGGSDLEQWAPGARLAGVVGKLQRGVLASFETRNLEAAADTVRSARFDLQPDDFGYVTYALVGSVMNDRAKDASCDPDTPFKELFRGDNALAFTYKAIRFEREDWWGSHTLTGASFYCRRCLEQGRTRRSELCLLLLSPIRSHLTCSVDEEGKAVDRDLGYDDPVPENCSVRLRCGNCGMTPIISIRSLWMAALDEYRPGHAILATIDADAAITYRPDEKPPWFQRHGGPRLPPN